MTKSQQKALEALESQINWDNYEIFNEEDEPTGKHWRMSEVLYSKLTCLTVDIEMHQDQLVEDGFDAERMHETMAQVKEYLEIFPN